MPFEISNSLRLLNTTAGFQLRLRRWSIMKLEEVKASIKK
jgi:hypothetical protein